MVSLAKDALTLLLLALPVVAISWTVTEEELFREPREWCKAKSENGRSFVARKASYVFTCTYCFSHYVTIGMLAVTRFKLLYDDWRGYLVAGFALVWIANMYAAVFALLRAQLKETKEETANLPNR